MKKPMTMDDFKNKVAAMNNISSMIQSKTPQQLSDYSNQYKVADNDSSQSDSSEDEDERLQRAKSIKNSFING